MMEIALAMRRLLRVFCLVVIDLAAFYSSLLIAWVFRAEVLPHLYPSLPVFTFSYGYLVSLWWIPLIMLFFIFYEELYASNQPFWDEVRNLLMSATLAIATVMVIVTLGKMSDRVSRLVLLGTWVSSIFVFPVFRLWGKKVLYRLGVWRERVLVLGAGNAGRLVLEGLEREKHMGYEIAGFLDDDEQKRAGMVGGKKVLGTISDFPRFVKDLGITTVVIAMPSLTPERLSALTARVQKFAVNTVVIPDMKGIALLNTDLFHLFNEEIFLMNIRNNLKSGVNRLIKRSFDMIVCLGTMPLLLPLVLFIGLIIRIETPGPAIYSHERTGRHGRPFRCFKFRTMERDAETQLQGMLEQDEEMRSEWEKTRKLRDDPRITRVGRFLRRTSLDELPQIFNVLKGEMSLVGPRPVTREEIDLHYREAAELCFSVPPGVTGLWQISGRNMKDYDARVKLDAWYVMNWSLWLDIAILFRTVKVVARMEGAY